VGVETLTLSGVLVAVTIVVFERCIDRPQGSPIAFPAAIAAAGGLGLSICLSAGLVDTLSRPRSWPWPVIVWTTTGTAVVMLARLMATASWAGRWLQRGAADLAVILSVDPQAPSVAAARALLRARLGRPLRMRHVSIPSGDEVGQRIDAIIGSLRSLGPAEIILALADEAPQAIKPTATQMKLHDALATLPSRVWQATLGMARPDLKLLIDRPIGEFGWVAKRTLDVIGALLLILFTLPLFLIVAAAIKLDSRGPLLFRQYRVGYNDEPFEILKFRSMYHSACDAKGSRLTTRGDPRVTRVGRLIRRTSIDELPQLINVLRGEMSLVGPRPYPLSARAGERLYGEVVANIGRRHRVRPGLTGLAQVSGYRGDTETEARLIGRFALDLAYIERWSLWLDIKILLRTPMSGMLKADVY
jgi:exopolysaccharide biosynthesis polyprenyl glycosylphosphotransferase